MRCNGFKLIYINSTFFTIFITLFLFILIIHDTSGLNTGADKYYLLLIFNYCHSFFFS